MNYYQILGIPETASDKDIKRAYKKLVKKYHPDVFHGDKEFAENKIKEINEAYDTLATPELKAEYDDILNGNASSETIAAYKTTQAQDNYYNNNRYRDNDFYNSDSYRHYSSRYYGRTRPSQEFEEYRRSQSKVSEDGLFSGSKSKIIIIIGILAVIMILILIFLLSMLQNVTSNSGMFDDLSNGSSEKGILIIQKGVSYDKVVEYYGEPDKKDDTKGGFYAYYGQSYIVFDRNSKVTDWHNKGDFYTDYRNASQQDAFDSVVNELQEQMYFDL